RSGLVGEHPRLINLDNGNLPHAIDFRQIYATLLDQWLGVPSRPVLGQAYEAVDLLRRA
ncbi:MAG: Twin-arginine translocation pathway signal sequence domain-containing protein, partial [Planctomycetes bacterium]|nr:Twin-arginine translocation pathway signal sequence domain-containing protein [Planctomycetota bacterium]